MSFCVHAFNGLLFDTCRLIFYITILVNGSGPLSMVWSCYVSVLLMTVVVYCIWRIITLLADDWVSIYVTRREDIDAYCVLRCLGKGDIYGVTVWFVVSRLRRGTWFVTRIVVITFRIRMDYWVVECVPWVWYSCRVVHIDDWLGEHIYVSVSVILLLDSRYRLIGFISESWIQLQCIFIVSKVVSGVCEINWVW